MLSDTASQQALIRSGAPLHRPGVSLIAEGAHREEPAGVVRERPLALLEGSREHRAGAAHALGFDFDVMPMPTSAPGNGGRPDRAVHSTRPPTSDRGRLPGLRQLPRRPGRVASRLPPARQPGGRRSPTPSSSPGRLPKHASVFTFSVKSMQYPPLIEQWDALDAAIGPTLSR